MDMDQTLAAQALAAHADLRTLAVTLGGTPQDAEDAGEVGYFVNAVLMQAIDMQIGADQPLPRKHIVFYLVAHMLLSAARDVRANLYGPDRVDGDA